MTCECVLPRGGQSTSRWAPGPPSSIPFWAAAWGRSTPQGHLSPALPCWHLQWWDADEDRHNWDHGWTWAPHPHQLQPSVTSASPWASWVMWWLTSRHLCSRLPRGCLNVSINGIELVSVGLSFHWILRSRVREVIIIRDFDDFRLLWCYVILELTWGRSHTRVATSKTRQNYGVFGGNTSLYRVHVFDLLANPWSVSYTNQSPSSIHYHWSISRYGGQSQHCSSKENHLQAPTAGTLHMQLLGKHSGIVWNDRRTHSQSYIKMYKWSVYYVPLILLNFLAKLLPGKNSDKNFIVFTL